MKTYRHHVRRQGVVLIIVALVILVLVAIVALAVDAGYAIVVKADLQATADAAALAGASGLSTSEQEARLRAAQYALKNTVNGHPVALQPFDIQLGTWDPSAHPPFNPSGSPPHAVKVTAYLTAARGNPVGMFFAKVFGRQSVDVTATATAVFGSRDIALAMDYSGSMAYDSQFRHWRRLGLNEIILNLRHIWEDLGSPQYGNMQLDPVPLTGTSTQIKRALGLVYDDASGTHTVPYPYPHHPSGWDGYISYVKNDPDLASAGCSNRYGYLTLMDYWQTNKGPILESYNMTPDLWRTREQPVTAVKDAVTIFLAFLRQVETDDRVALVAYTSADGTAVLEVPLTTDFALIETTSRHRQAGHYHDMTNMAAGIEKARNELVARGRPGSLRMVVLLSDGVANYPSSSTAKQRAIDQAYLAAEDHLPIVTVSLGAQADTRIMQQIADITGGIHFNIPGGDDVSDYEDALLTAFALIAGQRPLKLVD